MKIAILTLPLHANYGGILQAYALQNVLERLGHSVEVLHIDFKIQRPPLWRYSLSVAARLYRKYIKRKNVYVFAERYINKTDRQVCHNMYDFIGRYIHTRTVKHLEEILPSDYDAFVVGSDQVWRPIYFHFPGGIQNAFLRFAKDWKVKRVAYAASFGTDAWEYSSRDTERCGELIKVFDAVSVREKSAVELCEQKFGVSAQWVLDPTFLLESNDYLDLISQNATCKPSGSLLCYILDKTPGKTNLLTEVAKGKNLVPFSVNEKTSFYGAPIEDRVLPPMEQWIRGFSEAEYVVTDSFHACVFSIIFKKQFVVVGNKQRGLTRIHSLLSLFGLENRLVETSDNVMALKPIDYVKVYERLGKLKRDSLEYLKVSLNG